jgi:putative membrane protein
MNIIKKAIIGVVLNGAALYGLTLAMEEVTYTGGVTFFIVGGVLMGFLNWAVKPIMKAISLPFIFITGGLFLILINGGLLWFLSYFLDIVQFREVSLTFPNLGSYAIGAVVFGVINWVEHMIIKNDS